MMGEMPRPRPPHLHRETSRHGKVVWYVRLPGQKRVRLRQPIGTAAFNAEYQAAVAGALAPVPSSPSTKSIAWLIGQYRQSIAFLNLSPSTRRQRELVLEKMVATGGDQPYAKISKKTIVAGLERRRDTPFAAYTFLKTVRHWIKWAIGANYLTADPSVDVETPARSTVGFRVWTEDDVERFEERWPIGTRERLALAILLFTGLRRGDAARLGRQHVKDGTIRIRTEKKRNAQAPAVLVTLPMHPELEQIIAASPTGDMTFVATIGGRAMTKESFGNWFREACDEAKVPGSAHGLRKAAATRLANNGATEAQLEAIFGWTGGKMAALYTREANRAKLARQGMEKFDEAETGTSIPAPTEKVREAEQKT